MHIVFLSDNFWPETNAPAARLLEHARVWARDGHRVTVVTCAPNFPEGRVFKGFENRWYQKARVHGIDVVRVKTYIAPNAGVVRRALDQLSFMVAGAVAGIVQERPDVVVATSPQFFAAIGGYAVSLVRRAPFVFELRDLWPASISAVGALRQGFALRALERIELFLYGRAKAIVAVTEAFQRDLVARGVDSAKIHVVTNGVDLTTYMPTARDEDLAAQWDLTGKLVVGYLGTHGMAHALENVLDAAERLRSRDDIRFLFVGSGAARASLVESAARRGLKNVVFVPSQPKEAMPRVWSLCDVALIHLKHTAVFETVIPSKVFEAMGMGVPVLLAAPKGEVSAIVERTGAGFHVAAEDPSALAQGVARLCDDAEERARFAHAGRDAAPQFSRDVLARRMLLVLERVSRRCVPSATANVQEAS